MSAYEETVARFRRAVAGPPGDIPLGRAALLIAQAEYPGLDLDDCERNLEEMATMLRARIAGAVDAEASLIAVNELLFSELGFRGNQEHYDDLRNHFLSDVLEQRTGIPITLATVFIEVCQRSGLRAQGVGLPGHVVCRFDPPGGQPRYVDVFNGGRLLSPDDCRVLVEQLYGRRMAFQGHFLAAVTPRQLLQRMLHNLKAHALQHGDEERASRAIDLLLAMYPWELDELRDRGLLRERLGDYPAALADLEQYVRYRAGARDIQTVSEAVRSLRRHVGRT